MGSSYTDLLHELVHPLNERRHSCRRDGDGRGANRGGAGSAGDPKDGAQELPEVWGHVLGEGLAGAGLCRAAAVSVG